jgi:DNA-binding MarR family transcriptional regulator
MKITIKSRYGVAPDKLLNDPNISLKAKGLFAYLQSKPDNWRFSVARITSQTKDGKDSVKSAIRELEKAGYLKRKPRKGDAGKWDGYDYILTENPLEMIYFLVFFRFTFLPSS